MCHFQVQNGPFAINKFFLVQIIIITFIYQNLKKILRWIRVMRMHHFWAQNGPFAPIFFWKIINIILIYLLKILKKFFQRIQSYQGAQFLGTKWSISQNENFFSENLLMSLVSFIHAYLHAKNQSQILIYK